MNSEPSPSDRYAGKVIVGIYLFIILWFSLLYISSAHCQVVSHDEVAKTEKSWDVQLTLCKDDQSFSAELYFRIR